MRQALAAVRGIGVEPDPAARRVGREGFLEAARRDDRAVLEAATLNIARIVEREDNLLADLGALIEDGVHDIAARVLESGKVAVVLDRQELVQDEADIAHRRLIGGHRTVPSS